MRLIGQMGLISPIGRRDSDGIISLIKEEIKAGCHPAQWKKGDGTKKSAQSSAIVTFFAKSVIFFMDG